MSQTSVNPLQTSMGSLLGSINSSLGSWANLLSSNMGSNSSSNSALPKALKVAAKTIGFDLVEEQPMAQPSGKLFYMDYEFEEPWVCLDENGNKTIW